MLQVNCIRFGINLFCLPILQSHFSTFKPLPPWLLFVGEKLNIMSSKDPSHKKHSIESSTDNSSSRRSSEEPHIRDRYSFYCKIISLLINKIMKYHLKYSVRFQNVFYLNSSHSPSTSSERTSPGCISPAKRKYLPHMGAASLGSSHQRLLKRQSQINPDEHSTSITPMSKMAGIV